ncbi:MAG: hypothetical protein EBR30_05015 [Cytophagia bacterium]|nr:hypothetical protein [Cytophagia bacterium]
MSKLSNNEYYKRLHARETAIYQWLTDKNLSDITARAQELLKSLDRDSIREEFASGIDLALDHCIENTEIKGLDFSWYFDGSSTDTAYAYGLDKIGKTPKLSKTDLGEESLPGIECDLKHGSLVDEDFADVPVHYAINLYVDNLQSKLKENETSNREDTASVVLQLFEIWNYKLAIEVCQTLPEDKLKAVASNGKPFWITMTRHGRWPIAIASFQA